MNVLLNMLWLQIQYSPMITFLYCTLTLKNWKRCWSNVADPNWEPQLSEFYFMPCRLLCSQFLQMSLAFSWLHKWTVMLRPATESFHCYRILYRYVLALTVCYANGHSMKSCTPLFNVVCYMSGSCSLALFNGLQLLSAWISYIDPGSAFRHLSSTLIAHLKWD